MTAFGHAAWRRRVSPYGDRPSAGVISFFVSLALTHLSRSAASAWRRVYHFLFVSFHSHCIPPISFAPAKETGGAQRKPAGQRIWLCSDSLRRGLPNSLRSNNGSPHPPPFISASPSGPAKCRNGRCRPCRLSWCSKSNIGMNKTCDNSDGHSGRKKLGFSFQHHPSPVGATFFKRRALRAADCIVMIETCTLPCVRTPRRALFQRGCPGTGRVMFKN